MKTFARQILILGGIYFIISSFLDVLDEDINFLCTFLLLLPFFVCFVILCLKRNLIFLQKIEEKFPKTSVYLLSLGVVQYFEMFFVTVPGIVYGYNAAMATYNNAEYVSIIPLYLGYAIYVYFFLIVLAVLGATCLCFVKSQN